MRKYICIGLMFALVIAPAFAGNVEEVTTRQGFTTLYEVKDSLNALATGGTLTNGLDVTGTVGADIVKSDAVTEDTAGEGVTVDVLTRVKDGSVLYKGTVGTDARAGWPIAFPPGKYSVFKDDFYTAGYVADAGTHTNNSPKFSEDADAGAWLVTVVDGGSDNGESIIVSDTGRGGILAIKCNDAKDDGNSIQKNGMGMELVSGKKLWFETKFAIEDADTNAVFIGLSIADTAMTAGLSDDHIGFYMTGLEDATLYIDCEYNGTNCNFATTTTMADSHATFTNMTTAGFYYDGANALYTWVNGNNTGMAMSTTITHTTTLVTNLLPKATDMSTIMEIISKDTAADDLYVDYIWYAVEL